jgi:hypothetical protein
MSEADYTSLDAILERYKRDIDITLLDRNRRLTVDERIAQLQRLGEFAEELRRARRVDTNSP